MALTLSILRCPDTAAPEAREVAGGAFSIGRAPDNDWMLPDPDRHLSKRHCIVAWRGGSWEIDDLSTNGTFLNREDEPIGAGRPRELRDKDRLRLGAYEIEVRIAEDASTFAAAVLPDPVDLPFAGPVQPDHSPAIEDVFRPPHPIALLADDWDLDPAATPAVPEPAASPLLPPAPAAPALGAEDDLLAAFLRGADLPDARPPAAAETMAALGAAFRALVGGLRETLIARAAVKGEFRIEQTMIRSRGNNPLKFSAGDDDAMAALLGVGRHTDMSAADAITEALRDIRLHELATVSALQSAVRALLRDLAPTKLRDQADHGRHLLPSQGKVRAWDAFEALHGRITQALEDNFDSVFGRAFARAYERALHEAGQRDERSRDERK